MPDKVETTCPTCGQDYVRDDIRPYQGRPGDKTSKTGYDLLHDPWTHWAIHQLNSIERPSLDYNRDDLRKRMFM